MSFVKKSLLYRQGYFDARTMHLEGNILLPANLNMTLYTLACMALLLGMLLFLFFGEFSRKARLEGIVMPSSGLVKVMARSDGYISGMSAAGGDIVRTGQTLYTLSAERYEPGGKSILALLINSLGQQAAALDAQKQREAAASQAQRRGLNERIRQLRDELHSAREELALAQRQAALVRSVMERNRRLMRDKYIAEAEFQLREIDYARSQGGVENLRQSGLRLEREISAADNEQVRLTEQEAGRIAELERQSRALEQQRLELEARRETAVTAPVGGRVAAVFVKEGQNVNNGETLLTLVPERSVLQVELYAPSRAVGFVKPGQRVGLRFASFPYEKFGVQYGMVGEVTRAAANSVGNVSAENGAETLYRVTVKLKRDTILAYGKAEPLRVGMRVAADVELDRRRIYEWLLEPLWTLKGKM